MGGLYVYKYKVIPESELQEYGGLGTDDNDTMVDIIWMPKDDTNKSKKKLFSKFKNLTFSSDKIKHLLTYGLESEYLCLYVVEMDFQRRGFLDDFMSEYLLADKDPVTYDDIPYYVMDNEDVRKIRTYAILNTPIHTWELAEDEVIYFYW